MRYARIYRQFIGILHHTLTTGNIINYEVYTKYNLQTYWETGKQSCQTSKRYTLLIKSCSSHRRQCSPPKKSSCKRRIFSEQFLWNISMYTLCQVDACVRSRWAYVKTACCRLFVSKSICREITMITRTVENYVLWKMAKQSNLMSTHISIPVKKR